jgi:hypothetical protein
MCDWDHACSGSGVIYCQGCGGDICVCTCGGERSCEGCEWCEPIDTEGDETDEELA